MLVLGVDPGIVHLGLALVEVTATMQVRCVLQAALVDLTQLPHSRIPKDICPLQHSSMHCDWVDHLLQEYSGWFERADTVVVEQQPPGGHTSIEQLLVKAVRHKVVVLCPRSVHAYLGISHMDYDQRKAEVVRLTEQLLRGMSDSQERKHDMADAVALVSFYVYKLRKEYLRQLGRSWLESRAVPRHAHPQQSSSLQDCLQRYRRRGC